jgi:murein DD-endopeptidase MepM/ murein hydrolase activator NlpD
MVAYGSVSRGSGSDTLVWPVTGPITSPFGWRILWGQRNFHTGMDIGVGYGTPVGAAAPGKVVLAGWDGGYGRCVLIDHGDGLATRYAHLSRIDVGLGEQVSRGAVVGNVGESGNADGPHLHFEVIINGNVQNPLLYLH